MKTYPPPRFWSRVLPQSIRIRLPLTYAGIALLVALSLGGVLIGILSEYYRQQEIDYLARNADAIQASLTQMFHANSLNEDLQADVNLLAFLSHTQINILNPDQTVVLASEPLMSVIDFTEEQPEMRLTVRSVASDEVWVDEREALFKESIVIETLEDEQVINDAMAVDFMLSATNTEHVTQTFISSEQIFISQEPGLYGFGLAQFREELPSTTQSSQVLMRPLYDWQNNHIGYLQMSQGPAYGVEIVSSVAWGWGIASVVSITLAVIVGYFISRDVSRPLQLLTETTKQMTAGDLSVRTHLHRQDELGILATAFNDMAIQIDATVTTLHHFVSDAAHEINTPITALRTNLELVHHQQQTKENQITLQRALQQVIRLEDLTRNLLQLSRLESQMNGEANVRLDTVTLIRDTVGFYASRADQANVTLELSFPKQPVICRGHEGHLRIALSNVIDNAIKFTPADGRVCVSLDCADGEIAIHVRDTGVGIPPDHLPYVFNRFHRASNVSDYAGSGLGLSIVNAIVKRYDGSVSIKTLEQGTRVSIFLPCQNSSEK